jgi:hypothetical protein
MIYLSRARPLRIGDRVQKRSFARAADEELTIARQNDDMISVETRPSIRSMPNPTVIARSCALTDLNR